MKLIEKSKEELKALSGQYEKEYAAFKALGIDFDLTRGKPSGEQLALSEGMEGILEGDFISREGADTRNYGGLDGLAEAKELLAPILGVVPGDMLIGGNSSLQLMFQYVTNAFFFGPLEGEPGWAQEGKVKFLCPVPGYDRHFTICEYLGIEMIPVPMNSQGPDMEKVFELVQQDSSIKGIWCVPKYSNPTGVIYSQEVVRKLAELPGVGGRNFRVLWDNAYALHDLEEFVPVDSLLEEARKAGTEDGVVLFGSTSKISFAGAGLGFMAASASNLKQFQKYLSVQTIGPDKMNQWRHVKFFRDFEGLLKHMKKHARILKPKFDLVLTKLKELSDLGIGTWLEVRGGYFVSFDTLEGTASEVIALCEECGVKLTPSGSTFPYKKDPRDTNIRIAPTFPGLDAIGKAMDVFVCCVKLASARKLLGK